MKQNNSVAIIANGHLETSLRSSIIQYPRIVAVDGGLIHCHNMGIKPDLIVGDLDSAPFDLTSQYADTSQIILPVDKDETDLEFAIGEELRLGAKTLTLFAAWGLRIDHSLANALLLTRFPQKVFLETEKEHLFAIETHLKIKCFPEQTLSLIPISGPVSGIFTKGLKWELKNRKMDQNFFGISNICLNDEVEISISQGILLCCQIKPLLKHESQSLPLR